MREIPRITSGLEWADELARRLTEFHQHWQDHRPKASSLEPAPQDLQTLIAHLIMEVQREVRGLSMEELRALYDDLPEFHKLKEELKEMTEHRDRLEKMVLRYQKRDRAADMLLNMEG